MLRKYSYFIILGFITLHSLLLNGYLYGYGFNYIPFGYSLPSIFVRQDPTLYPRDMFVQSSIHRNTYFYDIVAYFTRFIEIEKFAFFLHIFTLYLTLLGIFCLTTTLFKKPIIAYCATLLYAYGLRQWALGDPCIYFCFLNPGAVAYPILIFSLNYFLKKRYLLSFFLNGLVFNIHALFSIHMCFLFLSYFILNYRSLNRKIIFLSLLFLTLPSIPIFFTIFSAMGGTNFGDEWLQVIRFTLWFHHFLSDWDVEKFLGFLIFFSFFLISIKVAPQDDKYSSIIILLLAPAFLCLIGAFFTEVVPIPLIIRLHVWGGTWIFYIFAIIYMSNFLISSWGDSLWKQFAIVGVMPITAGYIGPYWLLPIFLMIILIFNFKEKLKGVFKVLISFPILILIYLLIANLLPQLSSDFLHIRPFVLGIFLCLILFLFFNKFVGELLPLKISKWVILTSSILFIIFFDFAFLYQKGGPLINYRGYSKKYTPPWVDIQLYVRDHTPKDVLLITPPYLEGFTVFSERSILGDWLVGATSVWANNDHASEWLRRMKMIGWKNFKDKKNNWPGARRGYTSFSTDGFIQAAKKYNANYVVFEKVGEKRLNLPIIYENKQFILYAIEDEENLQRKRLPIKDSKHT